METSFSPLLADMALFLSPLVGVCCAMAALTAGWAVSDRLAPQADDDVRIEQALIFGAWMGIAATRGLLVVGLYRWPVPLMAVTVSGALRGQSHSLLDALLGTGLIFGIHPEGAESVEDASTSSSPRSSGGGRARASGC